MVNYSSQISKIEVSFIFDLFSGVIASFFCLFLIYVLFSRDFDIFSSFRFNEITKLILKFISIFVLFVISIFFIMLTYNRCKDIPNVLKRKYIEDTCIVIGQDAGGIANESRSVQVKCSKTDSEFTFLTNYLPMKNGEIYRIIYLPNTKFGAVVEKIE